MGKIDKQYLTRFYRIVIGIDPAVTSHEESDETGIIVAGRKADGSGVIIDDLSGRYTPHEWGKVVVDAYHQYKADRVVGEVNQGGDMVEHTLRVLSPSISFRAVRASRGKHVRAEPVAALYEQGKIFHREAFPQLETQMVSYMPGAAKSPDRVDALVWALTDLFLEKQIIMPRAWII